jgi:hypothetical protein
VQADSEASWSGEEEEEAQGAAREQRVRLLRERFAGVTRQRLLFDALVRQK